MSKSSKTWLASVSLAFVAVCTSLARPGKAADWPMLGRDATRNSVSETGNGPVKWQLERRHEQGRIVEPAKGIRWSAKLGSQTFASPVVSQGLVWIGTNLGDGRLGSVLKCFREDDGKLAYEYVTAGLEAPFRANEQRNGFGCLPLVEGGNLWFTTPRCEVVCLDIANLVAGKGQPREDWKLDMTKSLGVFPRAGTMPRTCSIAASFKGRIYVVTGNGVDDRRVRSPAPNAPALVCLDKATGQIEWADRSPDSNVANSPIADPLVATINGGGQAIVAQGDGWLRSFEPLTGAFRWKFDVNHKAARRQAVIAAPVLYRDRVYVVMGNDPEYGEGQGRLVCIDPNRQGDISSELDNGNANPNSGLVWELMQQDHNQNGQVDGFEETFHLAVGSVAISDGLLIAVDFSGLVHCLDAESGAVYWTHDLLAASWSAPLIVDGKAYVVDEDGDVAVFNVSANPAEAMTDVNAGRGGPIALVNMGSSIYSSPVFANGTLYVATRTELFAIEGEE